MFTDTTTPDTSIVTGADIAAIMPRIANLTMAAVSMAAVSMAAATITARATTEVM